MLRFRQSAILFFVTYVATVCPVAAQTNSTVTVVLAANLGSFLAMHKGPVLDVRMPGDCDENRRLRRTSTAIGFDFGADNPDGRKMARDLFLSEFKASSRMSTAAKRGETILVVCCAGGRSEAAAALLSGNGWKVAHVPGGMQSDAIPASVLRAQR